MHKYRNVQVQRFPTHSKSFNDQISGLELSLHDAQKGKELWFAQVVDVQLTFLKHTEQEHEPC